MARAEFDVATAVRPASSGVLRAQISPRWCIGEAPSGGYLLAIVLRALRTALPHDDPFTVTGHFLSAPQPGPATVTVDTLRAGRTLSRAAASLEQDGRDCLRVLAAFGSLADDAVPLLADTRRSELPPRGECLRQQVHTPDGRRAHLREHLDIRYHPDSVGWARGGPTGRARLDAWVRCADGRAADALMVVLTVDALPSAVFDLGVTGWIPTVELTVHLRARPAGEWLQCSLRSRLAAGGLVEEDALVWDERDRLVAMSRQLALLPAAAAPRRAGPRTDR